LPINISANQLRIATTSLTDPLIFPNIDGYTMTSPTAYILMQATSPGNKYNLSSDTTLRQLNPIVGLTVSNPGDNYGATLVNGWITNVGSDQESDDALRARNQTIWQTLSYTGLSGFYEYLLRSTHSSITRVSVI